MSKRLRFTSSSTYEEFLRFLLELARQDARDWEERCKRVRLLVPRSRRRWTVADLKRERERRKKHTADARNKRRQKHLQNGPELERRVKALRREGIYTYAQIADLLRDEGVSITRQRASELARRES